MDSSTIRLVTFIVMIAAGILIAKDAKTRGMNHFAWGIGAFFLWIVVVPLYLIVRKPIGSQLLGDTSPEPKQEEKGLMRNVAKWVLILWSLFCLVGVFVGMANVGSTIEKTSGEMERAGAGIGMGCAMAMWVGIWAAIALPALIIYLVAGKKEPIRVSIEPEKQSTLCTSCGKYYAGKSRFCPNCGQPTA
jgi:hydrogenase-4 membrane subunit HyfE